MSSDYSVKAEGLQAMDYWTKDCVARGQLIAYPKTRSYLPTDETSAGSLSLFPRMLRNETLTQFRC